jgi:hypothetical protein
MDVDADDVTADAGEAVVDSLTRSRVLRPLRPRADRLRC